MRSGLLRERQVHRAGHVVGGHHAAVMDVGEQPDPQTIERGRETRDRKRRFGDADAMALERDAVGAGAGGGADRRHEHAFDRRAAGEHHSDELYSSG